MLPQFLARLAQFEKWFTEQHEFEFIASSLLFLYNSDVETSTGHDSEAALTLALAPDIRLIDFAHIVYRAPDARQVDTGVLTGIRTITRCFEELLTECQASDCVQECESE